MTRVAIVTWVVDSYGEREQALRFAAQLPDGVEPVFIAPALVAPHLAPYRTETFADVDGAMRAIAREAPALVIGNEYYNLPPALQQALIASGLRLATFDGTSMGLAINTNPFATPTPMRTMALPPAMFRLRACPINDPAADRADLFHWRLFDRLHRSDGAAPRRLLGIPRDVRLAVLAIAPWAVSAAMSLGVLDHYERLTRRLADAFTRAGQATALVVIAPIARPAVRHGATEIRFIEYLPRAAYEALLLGADLVVSDNAIQTSIAKAAVAGIPTLVVVNSRPELGPTYQMFPLKVELPRASRYLGALAPVELGDPDALAAHVAQAWARGPTPGWAAYLASLDQVASPGEILRAAGVLP